MSREWGAKWAKRVDLADLWNDDDLPFIEKRDQIVARLRVLNDWSATVEDSDWLPFVEIVENLADSEDEEDFDFAWGDLYDWADRDKRLWIEIFVNRSEQVKTGRGT